jgi:TPR repeat protein
MTHTMWKVICRPGIAVLVTVTIWTPMATCSDTGMTKELTQVRELAKRGSIRDEIALAGVYFAGKGVAQDSKMAAYWYEKAAGHGSPEAQNQIGYFYETGTGVTPDVSRALHWYQLAAATGFAPAKVNLAIAYLHGSGVAKNEELAMQLLTQAFQGGNGTAATYLGDISYFGIGVKEDKIAGERWFEQGLKLHDPLAAFNLGSLYSVTEDHSHDLAKAAGLLRLAADAGYVPAMHSLGLLLVNHSELKQEPQQSRDLLETAAKAGSWKSSIVLGILAREGRGEPADYKAAYFHFRLALLQGHAEASHVIKRDTDALGAKISDEDRQTAATAANTWFERQPFTLAFVFKDSNRGDFPAAALASASDGSFAGQLLPLSSS